MRFPTSLAADRSDAPVEVRIEGLEKAFDGHPVLEGVDLTIRRGEVVAIVGGSGCGKTVLLNHVLGALDPDRGRVLVADHSHPGAPLVDLAGLDDEATARLHVHWGMVFQRNALFSGSVHDNIALWLREIARLEDEAIAEIAREVLAAVALPTDDGFLATPVESLSGGMAKRLAVARALSMRPTVLFYDEPTTGLDPQNAAQIHDLILATHRAPAGDGATRTTVIVTHDKDLLATLAPRVVMLHAGRVAFDGPYTAFRASPSAVVRPYFARMPDLHGRSGATVGPGGPPPEPPARPPARSAGRGLAAARRT